jgi:hypothetical protein
MADQAQSTDRPLSNVFRESFLALLEQPEHEAAFRVVGDLLRDLAYEGRRLLTSKADDGSSTRRSVHGATGDVLQAVEQLADLGRLVEEASLSREESRLLLAVGDAAADLQPIAEHLAAAFAAFAAGADEG